MRKKYGINRFCEFGRREQAIVIVTVQCWKMRLRQINVCTLLCVRLVVVMLLCVYKYAKNTYIDVIVELISYQMIAHKLSILHIKFWLVLCFVLVQ